MECEKVDSAPKSLLCLTAVPCQEEASVLLSLEFCWIIFSPSACDYRCVGFTVSSYQVFEIKFGEVFHGVVVILI